MIREENQTNSTCDQLNDLHKTKYILIRISYFNVLTTVFRNVDFRLIVLMNFKMIRLETFQSSKN
jgi:hypothetical protein